MGRRAAEFEAGGSAFHDQPNAGRGAMGGAAPGEADVPDGVEGDGGMRRFRGAADPIVPAADAEAAGGESMSQPLQPTEAEDEEHEKGGHAGGGEAEDRVDQVKAAAEDDGQREPEEGGAHLLAIGKTRYMSRGARLLDAISAAYGVTRTRIIAESAVPEDRYDSTVQSDADGEVRPLIRELLSRTFHIEAKPETRQVEVYLLRRAEGQEVKLKPVDRGGTTMTADNSIKSYGSTMPEMARMLEGAAGRPVVDETGITGYFAFQFFWEKDNAFSFHSQLQAETGLTLVPGARPVEALLVRRSRERD